MDNLSHVYYRNEPFLPPSEKISAPSKQTGIQKPSEKAEVPFNDILSQTIETQDKLRFSAHAQQRFQSRDIRMDERQLERLNQAVNKAEQKGARDALVLVDNVAAIVSVDNKTVVTVTDTRMLRDNVYTNIDSAVIG